MLTYQDGEPQRVEFQVTHPPVKFLRLIIGGKEVVSTPFPLP
jgi:hypothetical protein